MTTLTDTVRRLHDAVCRAGHDLDLRLVLADAMEESGQAERAEFVRLQLATHNAPLEKRNKEMLFKDWNRMSERAKELLLANYSNWHPLDWDAINCSKLPTVSVSVRGGPSHVATWRNGFPDHITCTLDTWLAHGRAIVRQTPVAELVISDREPALHDIPGDRYFFWLPKGMVGMRADEDYPYLIPPAIYSLLPRHKHASREAAVRALGEAAIRWAWS